MCVKACTQQPIIGLELTRAAEINH